MNHIFDMKLNPRFFSILAKLEKPTVSRYALIQKAKCEFDISINQAAGLIDRGISLLKKHDLVFAEGSYKTRKYIFSFNLIRELQIKQEVDPYKYLNRAKITLEKELSITSYEIDTYSEMKKLFPNESNKIKDLQESASLRMLQLDGKIRAINRLIAHK